MASWRRLLPLVRQQLGKLSHAEGTSGALLRSEAGAWSGPCRGGWKEFVQMRAGFASSSQVRRSAAGESVEPVRSPLSQAPGPLEDGAKSAATQDFARAVLSEVRISPKKVNLVAALVRGMRCADALMQMQVLPKRAAKIVYKVVHSARANAIHNHGLDKERLVVSEAFVGKGQMLKRRSYHAKGRSGTMKRPRCHLTVILKEMTAEQEAELARVRVMSTDKFRRVTSRLMPHQVRETRWARFQAERKAKGESRVPASFSRPKPGLHLQPLPAPSS